MSLKNDKINFIKQNLKLQEVIQFYTNAQFNYKNKCCCPLPNHTEDTPSFSINTKKNQFRCYGCGAFGDLIDFVMINFNLVLNEAVDKLIKDFNLPFVENKKSKVEEYKEEQLKNKKRYEQKKLAIEIESINRKIIPKLRNLRFQSYLLFTSKNKNKLMLENIKNEINKYEEIYLILNNIKINDTRFSQKELLEKIESGKIII